MQKSGLHCLSKPVRASCPVGKCTAERASSRRGRNKLFVLLKQAGYQRMCSINRCHANSCQHHAAMMLNGPADPSLRGDKTSCACKLWKCRMARANRIQRMSLWACRDRKRLEEVMGRMLSCSSSRSTHSSTRPKLSIETDVKILPKLRVWAHAGPVSLSVRVVSQWSRECCCTLCLVGQRLRKRSGESPLESLTTEHRSASISISPRSSDFFHSNATRLCRAAEAACAAENLV